MIGSVRVGYVWQGRGRPGQEFLVRFFSYQDHVPPWTVVVL